MKGKILCIFYLWSQVAADGECEMDVEHKMNEEHKAWRAMAEEAARQCRNIERSGEPWCTCR